MEKETSKKRPRTKEVERILNCVPSLNPEKDWTITAALDSGLLTAPATPASKDLRAPTWWAVGDQGSTGSCVGWGTADSVLRWHFVMASRLSKSEPLSVRYVWMAAKETDEFNTRPSCFIEQAGTSLKAALDVARKFGVVTNLILPFSPPSMYTGNENTFWALAAQRKISSYFNLGRNLASWRSWIANSGPILTRLDVDSTWDNATQTKGNLQKYAGPGRGGHCVALVGYTPNYFIVRNSWGTSWGANGFAYAYDAYAQEAFTEAYGVAL